MALTLFLVSDEDRVTPCVGDRVVEALITDDLKVALAKMPFGAVKDLVVRSPMQATEVRAMWLWRDGLDIIEAREAAD